MTGLKDLLRKKERIGATADGQIHQQGTEKQPPAPGLDVPEFKIIRSTTGLEEEIEIPSFDDEEPPAANTTTTSPSSKRKTLTDRKPHLHFRKSSNAALTKDPTAIIEPTAAELAATGNSDRASKRLSHRLHFRSHSRSASAESTSEILPENLPDAPEVVSAQAKESSRDNVDDASQSTTNVKSQEEREAQWEKRATLLAQAQQRPLAEMQLVQQLQQARLDSSTSDAASTRSTTTASDHQQRSTSRRGSRSRSHSRSISDARGDDDIQEAIRLHELGELGLSTAMFGRLGDPGEGGENGNNSNSGNALAQVLYGLALRHGWGVPADPTRAVRYLSLAAANSAAVEKAALDAGMVKGGAAKGELVLAIYELANCFRWGWGVKIDAKAARAYYETAANLGDVDAMEEAAWCFVEGFGGSKDKFKAAQYLRLAEEKGRRQVGNSWIWKDKYNPK